MRGVLYSLVLVLGVGHHLWVWDKQNSNQKEQSSIELLGFDQYRLQSLSGGEIDDQVLRKLPDFKAIADIYIPTKKSSDEQWRLFTDNVLDLNSKFKERAGRVGKISHDSPYIVFLSYIAKYRPQLLMSLVEDKKVTISAFNHLVQMGFLQNWLKLANHPEEMIRSSRIGLLRVALNQGVDQAENIAKKAFLSPEFRNNLKFKISLVNLRFALKAMTKKEKLRVAELLEQKVYGVNINEVRQLRGLYSDEMLLSFIQANQNTQFKQQQFWLDAAQMNSKSAVEVMLTDYSRYLGDDKLRRRYSTQRSAACNVCFLSLSTDGLMFTHQQAKQQGYRPTEYKVVNGSGGLVIQSLLEKEALNHE